MKQKVIVSSMYSSWSQNTLGFMYGVRSLDDRTTLEKILPRKNCNFSQMKIEIKSFCCTRHTPASSHSMNKDFQRIVKRRNHSLITMFLCAAIAAVHCSDRTTKQVEFICYITNYREKLEIWTQCFIGIQALKHAHQFFFFWVALW